MSVQFRPVDADEIETFLRSMGVPFGFDATPEAIDRFRNAFELDRTRAAVDGDQIVATFGALSVGITVPGGVLPLAGTTIVTVLPTHRRQGILRRMMVDHFADLHQRGEPLAALWASESSIYGRFGYGPACEKAVVKLDKSYARLREPVKIGGSMRLIDRNKACEILPPIYDAVATERPGLLVRKVDWWRHRVLRDPEYMRRGATALRHVVHHRDGSPVGYVLYRTRNLTDQVGFEVQVVELIGIDDRAEKALWQFLFGIDLSASFECWNQPIDYPLRWWLEHPRRLERKIEDGLWLRLIDVRRALASRRYSCPGSLALRVRDEQCPWNNGTWQLVVDKDGVGQCQPTNAEPDLDLSPQALGMTYLGGHRFTTLARGGLASGSQDAIRRADAIFNWDVLPTCTDFF
jgi:predicted acetyltransferase